MVCLETDHFSTLVKCRTVLSFSPILLMLTVPLHCLAFAGLAAYGWKLGSSVIFASLLLNRLQPHTTYLTTQGIFCTSATGQLSVKKILVHHQAALNLSNQHIPCGIGVLREIFMLYTRPLNQDEEKAGEILFCSDVLLIHDFGRVSNSKFVEKKDQIPCWNISEAWERWMKAVLRMLYNN